MQARLERFFLQQVVSSHLSNSETATTKKENTNITRDHFFLMHVMKLLFFDIKKGYSTYISYLSSNAMTRSANITPIQSPCASHRLYASVIQPLLAFWTCLAYL